jgi:acetyltransferase-like isoleucine patch superfamily enzyme
MYLTVRMLPRPRIPFKHFLLFGWMPSPLKVLAYRLLLGYRIGRHVRIGLGSVIVGDAVELGDHVEIGMLTIVMGRRIAIGRFSSVGTMSYLSCTAIEIGEDAKIREQVFVGGPQLPESRFTLGSRTIVLQMANINATKPVVIGDDTGIGGHCLIFTHGAWLNALDGYPVNYEPVTLGKSVWLPWRVFVMPGTTIGDGSVIGANSLVSGTIPPSSLAVGSPARVIKSAPDFPRKLSDAERAAKVAEIVAEFERCLKDGSVTISEAPPWRMYTRGWKTWRLLWLRSGDGRDAAPERGDTVLSEQPLAAAALERCRAGRAHWLDLGARTRSVGGSPLTEELASFIARYGIRLARDR